MSPEELNRHYAEGLCLNCHKPGHKSRECPDRMTVPGGTRTQPPGIAKPRENGTQRSTASVATALTAASTKSSYADLND